MKNPVLLFSAITPLFKECRQEPINHYLLRAEAEAEQAKMYWGKGRYVLLKDLGFTSQDTFIKGIVMMEEAPAVILTPNDLDIIEALEEKGATLALKLPEFKARVKQALMQVFFM